MRSSNLNGLKFWPEEKKQGNLMNKIMVFLKQNYSAILKLTLGLFLLYWVVFVLTPKAGLSEEQKNQLDSLNIAIQQLHEDNLKLEGKISDFNNELNQVDNNLSKLKNQKTIIKEIYHEKISNIDKLTFREVDSFFTNRYK